MCNPGRRTTQPPRPRGANFPAWPPGLNARAIPGTTRSHLRAGRAVFGHVEQPAAGLAEHRVAEHDLGAHVQRHVLVAAAAILVFDRRQGVFAPLADHALVELADRRRQGASHSFNSASSRLMSPWIRRLLLLRLRRGRCSAFWRARPGRLLPRRSSPGKASIFSSAFEDLVGQHAVGHLVGGDLVLQDLVLAVAAAALSLRCRSLIFSSPAFSWSCFWSAAMRSGLGLGLGLGQLPFAMGDVRLGGADLLRPALAAALAGRQAGGGCGAGCGGRRC